MSKGPVVSPGSAKGTANPSLVAGARSGGPAPGRQASPDGRSPVVLVGTPPPLPHPALPRPGCPRGRSFCQGQPREQPIHRLSPARVLEAQRQADRHHQTDGRPSSSSPPPPPPCRSRELGPPIPCPASPGPTRADGRTSADRRPPFVVVVTPRPPARPARPGPPRPPARVESIPRAQIRSIRSSVKKACGVQRAGSGASGPSGVSVVGSTGSQS